MSEAPDASERYLSASSSSNLRLVPDQACDADKLLAAAYSTRSDVRRNIALAAWRIRATANGAGAKQLSEDLGKMLTHKYNKKRVNRHPQLTRVTANEISMQVLRWWQYPKCNVCMGRGHPVIPGTPVLDYSTECDTCGGTGDRSLERMVKPEHSEHAKWLQSTVISLCSYIFDDMATLLKGRMNIGDW